MRERENTSLDLDLHYNLFHLWEEGPNRVLLIAYPVVGVPLMVVLYSTQ